MEENKLNTGHFKLGSGPRHLYFQLRSKLLAERFIMQGNTLPKQNTRPDQARPSVLIIIGTKRLDQKYGLNTYFRTYLVNLKLRKQRVEAVDLLPLLHKGVVLGDALQCELVHQVDLVRVTEVLPHEMLHGQWEGCRVQEDLWKTKA